MANIATAIAAITGADTKLSMGVVAVSDLSAATATTAAAKLSWASSGDGVTYKYSTDNVNWSAAISTLYVNLTGLNSETSYTYYIKAVKAGMIDSDSQVASFTTPTAEA